MQRVFTIILVFLTTLGFASQVQAQVVINELLPNPSISGDRSEWVELYNYSNADVDLSTWTLDGKQISEQQLLLPAQSYHIVTKDLEDFTTEFGTYENVSELSISLSNSGDTVELSDSMSYLDQVSYSDNEPDLSWERSGPFCNEFELHAVAHSLATENSKLDPVCFPQVEDPTPDKPELEIELSTDGENWSETVQAVGVQQLHFRYLTTAEVENSEFTLDGEVVTSPHPLQALTGSLGLEVTVDGEIYNYQSADFTIFPELQITEFMPQVSAGQEWIEVYNPNDFTVNLAGLELQVEQQTVLPLDRGQLAPGGYMQLLMPSSSLPNCSQPSDCEPSISLVWNELILAQLSYSDSLPDQSWSLTESGWSLEQAVTPAAANEVREEIVKSLQISEIYPSPLSGEQEWLELYNFGDEAISLESWSLADASGEQFLTGDLAAGGYLVIEAPDFSLNNAGDSIQLFYENELIDIATYGDTEKGVSQVRAFHTDSKKYLPALYATESVSKGVENTFTQDEVQTESAQAEPEQISQSTPVSRATPKKVLGVGDTGITEYKLPEVELQRQPEFVVAEEEPVTEFLPVALSSTSGLAAASLLLWESRRWLLSLGRRALQWWAGG